MDGFMEENGLAPSLKKDIGSPNAEVPQEISNVHSP